MNYALSAVLMKVLEKLARVLDLALEELEARKMERDGDANS